MSEHILKAVFLWAEALYRILDIVSKPCYEYVSFIAYRRYRFNRIFTVYKWENILSNFVTWISSRDSSSIFLLWKTKDYIIISARKTKSVVGVYWVDTCMCSCIQDSEHIHVWTPHKPHSLKTATQVHHSFFFSLSLVS